MAPTDTLTQRQLSVYKFIRDKITLRGYGPTVREIADAFGIKSPNGVMGHLRALEKKGLIIRDKNKSRAIELTPEALEEQRGLPLAGVVAAGPTHLAFEQNERIDFSDLFSGSEQFVLQVSGESMIDAHISDGDFVVVGFSGHIECIPPFRTRHGVIAHFSKVSPVFAERIAVEHVAF